MKTLYIKNDNKRYQPSQELINIVKSKLQQSQSINIFTKQSVFSNITEAQVSILIYQAVTGFLATIAQGLAYGDGAYAQLGKNGKLNQDFIEGMLVRVPVKYETDTFSEILYNDLLVAVKEQTISSEFGKLVMKNNELTLERIKIIPQKNNTTIKRAQVSRLG